MSKIERLRLPGSTELPVNRGRAETALPPLLRHLLLFALFAGGAGFWFAVIWWLFV